MNDLEQKISEVLHEAADMAHNFLRSDLIGHLLKRCESPIEEVFLCATWARAAWLSHVDFKVDPTVTAMMKAATERGCVMAAPQVPLGQYRVDFLLVAPRFDGDPPFFVVVECDGHAFHERTKEQAARDKSRDRDLQAMGAQVLRFTGAEIWHDAASCAEAAVLRALEERHASMIRARSRREAASVRRNT